MSPQSQTAQIQQNRFATVANQLQGKTPVGQKAKALIEGIAHQMEADSNPEVQACGQELRDAEPMLIQALQT